MPTCAPVKRPVPPGVEEVVAMFVGDTMLVVVGEDMDVIVAQSDTSEDSHATATGDATNCTRD